MDHDFQELFADWQRAVRLVLNATTTGAAVGTLVALALAMT